MKLTIPSKTLRDAMSIVLRVVPSKSPLPALQSVLIDSTESLAFSAQDGDTSIIWRVADPKPGARGAVLVNAHRLHDIAAWANGDVGLAKSDRGVQISTSAGNLAMPTADVKEFPPIDAPKGKPLLTLPAGELHRALALVSFAAAKEEGKYAMRGVQWECGDGKLRLIATDGKWLAWKSLNVDVTEERSALLPPKAMGLLATICREAPDDSPVSIWLAKTTATFTVGGATLSTKQVEGQFPKWQDAIPKAKAVKAKVPLVAGEFLRSVWGASLVVDDESKRVQFAFKAGKVLLHSLAATGEAKIEHALPDYDGPAMAIAFDPAYLIDFLGVLPSDAALSLEMAAPDKSAVFRMGKEYLCLIVPLVLNEGK